MAALFNPRHERFCREYMKIGIASRAFLAAGYRPTNRNSLDACSSRLLSSPKVRQRILELGKMNEKKHEVTVASLIADLEDDRQLARENKQAAAAVSANIAKARLLGLIVDRKETGAPGDFSAMSSADEILDKVRKELGDHAADLLAGLMKPDVPEPTHDAPDGMN